MEKSSLFWTSVSLKRRNSDPVGDRKNRPKGGNCSMKTPTQPETTLWSNLILERGLTTGREGSAGCCNVCQKGWFSQRWQRPPESLLGKQCFPASRDPAASVLWDLLLTTVGRLLSQPLNISQTLSILIYQRMQEAERQECMTKLEKIS